MRPRVPVRFREADMRHVSPRQFGELLEYHKRLLDRMSKGVGLFVSGPPGVGKTYAVVALTLSYAKAGRDYEFVSAPDLFDNILDFRDRDVYRDQEWLRTYCTVPWLVLNDLGKEWDGDGRRAAILGRVLRSRSEQRRVTHVTTNLAVAEFRSTYGDAVSSLIAESMIAFVVSGKDRRKCK